MSKNGLILTSLVGAIPGLLLVVLMAMAFVNYAGGPGAIHKVLCVTALLIGLLLMAMPVGIFVLAGPKAEKAPAKKDEEAAEVVEAASGEVVEAEEASSGELYDEEGEAAAVTDPNLEVDEGPPDEFAVTGEVVTDEAEAEAEDFVADDELEVEEDEVPKKGKKK